MNFGSVVAIIFGLGFVVAAWALYVMARRASPERRYFRMSAYAEMVVLTFAGIIFITAGILAS
jgi:multisubunit Na+/H+ antiporter MnhE subunit